MLTLTHRTTPENKIQSISRTPEDYPLAANPTRENHHYSDFSDHRLVFPTLVLPIDGILESILWLCSPKLPSVRFSHVVCVSNLFLFSQEVVSIVRLYHKVLTYFTVNGHLVLSSLELL